MYGRAQIFLLLRNVGRGGGVGDGTSYCMMLITLLDLGEILGISSLIIFEKYVPYFLGVLYRDLKFLMQNTRVGELIYIPIMKKKNYSICDL